MTFEWITAAEKHFYLDSSHDNLNWLLISTTSTVRNFAVTFQCHNETKSTVAFTNQFDLFRIYIPKRIVFCSKINNFKVYLVLSMHSYFADVGNSYWQLQIYISSRYSQLFFVLLINSVGAYVVIFSVLFVPLFLWNEKVNFLRKSYPPGQTKNRTFI